MKAAIFVVVASLAVSTQAASSNVTSSSSTSSSSSGSSISSPSSSSVTASLSSSSSSSSTSSSSSSSSTSSKSSTLSTSSNVIGSLILQGLAASSTPQDSVSQCQSSQVSWSEAYSKAKQPSVTTITTTYTIQQTVLTEDYLFGSADIYTTSDDVPRAHGTLKATSTSQYIGPWSDTGVDTYTSTVTKDTPFSNPSPGCTIGTSICSGLWESYFASLGLPTTPLQNRTEPAITPVPTNRPRCSIGPVTHICSGPTKSQLCGLSASKIDVFYWPAVTTPASNSGPVTAVYQNMTFTSPSVYLRFDTLQTISSGNFDETCTAISPLGATGPPATGVGGATIGRTAPDAPTSVLASLRPGELTSLIRDLGPGINTASVVSEIAHHGPSYSYWINAIAGTGVNAPQGYGTSVAYQQVNFADLAHPRPEAYYLNIETALGCHRVGPQDPNCGIIFEGAYRAQLQVPPQVRSLRPEWADCGDALFGAQDPPIALQAVANLASPTVPGGGAVSASPTPAASNKPTQPLPGSNVPPAAGPTSSPTAPASNPPPPSQPDKLSPSPGPGSSPSANSPSPGPAAQNSGNQGSPSGNQNPPSGNQAPSSGNSGSSPQNPGNQNSPPPGSGQSPAAQPQPGQPPSSSSSSPAPADPGSSNPNPSPNDTPSQASGLPVSRISSGVFVAGSSTLSAGGPAAVISGHTVSAATSGLVFDGSSVAVGNAATTAAIGTFPPGTPAGSSNVAASASNGATPGALGTAGPSGGGVTSGAGPSDTGLSTFVLYVWPMIAFAGLL